MILMYARVGRQGKAEGKPFAATSWFASGYFLVWAGFSLAATMAQWGIERAALLDSQMASASNILGGIVLIAAGAYQWTPLKDVCLAQCQTPFAVPDSPRRLSRRFAGLLDAGASARRVLCRLLLGSNGTFVRRRGDERALDRGPRVPCPFGEGYSRWAVDRAGRRSRLYHRGRLDVAALQAVILTT
jgi:hypothetical protein